METRADRIRALVFAVLLHVALFGIAVLGMFWTSTTKPLSVAGPVIEATLVTAPPASARRAERAARPAQTPPKAAEPEPEEAAPPPQPQPEPRPQDSQEKPQPKPQTEVPVPDTREQERVARLAQQQAEEQRKKEQEERKRQEQILLEERQKQEEAERKQRLAQQRAERLAKLAEIRKQREDAAKRTRMEQQRMQQLDDLQQVAAADPTPTPAQPAVRAGTGGTDESLLGQYLLAIQQAVLVNWTRPETVPPRMICKVHITQIVGGEVIDVQIDPSCPYDELGRRSVEAAILKAQPLPYAGFESVFQRNLPFNFCHPPEECRR